MGPSAMANVRALFADADGRLVIDTSNPNASGSLSPAERANASPILENGQIAGFLVVEHNSPFTLSDEQEILNRLNRSPFSIPV